MTTILSGWREQYDRMNRSYARFCHTSTGATSASSAEARDDLIHFFQDAYHLKDWLLNDPVTRQLAANIEADITADDDLSMCADLCNGTKHLSSRPGRRGGARAEITGQGVTIHPPTIRIAGGEQVPSEAGTASHNWSVDYEGSTVDASVLAERVQTFWNSWLGQRGLL